VEIRVAIGEWMTTLSGLMDEASDEDVFYLPSLMHLHAFEILKNGSFKEKAFTAEVCINE